MKFNFSFSALAPAVDIFVSNENKFPFSDRFKNNKTLSTIFLQRMWTEQVRRIVPARLQEQHGSRVQRDADVSH